MRKKLEERSNELKNLLMQKQRRKVGKTSKISKKKWRSESACAEVMSGGQENVRNQFEERVHAQKSVQEY